jgi:lipopolysaccharide/colanic/teichoic acid biosynthesis glycosyltransferase
MQADAEERLSRDGELKQRYVREGFKIADGEDPRVLPGMEWLRRTHIDELPQLVNVLRGEMSLVGPRPLVEEELGLYGEGRWTLLSRRPGVTGAWTAQGANRPPYPERARLELEYVRRAGLQTDLAILLRTARVVVGRWIGA